MVPGCCLSTHCRTALINKKEILPKNQRLDILPQYFTELKPCRVGWQVTLGDPLRIIGLCTRFLDNPSNWHWDIFTENQNFPPHGGSEAEAILSSGNKCVQKTFVPVHHTKAEILGQTGGIADRRCHRHELQYVTSVVFILQHLSFFTHQGHLFVCQAHSNHPTVLLYSSLLPQPYWHCHTDIQYVSVLYKSTFCLQIWWAMWGDHV